MDNSRYPKIAMHVRHGYWDMFTAREGEVDLGRGGWTGFKKDCEAMDMTIQDAISRAMDREKWMKSTMELPLRAFASSRH